MVSSDAVAIHGGYWVSLSGLERVIDSYCHLYLWIYKRSLFLGKALDSESERELIEQYGYPPTWDDLEEYVMAEKTQKELLQKLYQAVVGIPENPDENGLIGKVDDISELLKLQNCRIRRNEQKISKIWGILIGIGAVGGTGLGMGIKQLLGS